MRTPPLAAALLAKNGLLSGASTETLLWTLRWPPTLISSPSGPAIIRSGASK
jgi:hypothetical protein